jgi:hypothetical protein
METPSFGFGSVHMQNMTGYLLSYENSDRIAAQHLQACNVQINGYWDEDEFYEVIRFTQLPNPVLIDSSLGVTSGNPESDRWLQLRFRLTLDRPINPVLGELILILDETLEVIDENWLIDVHSPYVLATH